MRNTTARAFSVVASALGIPALLPFLKAVCQSKKSWQARHTGIKIVQQIAILLGCAVLPHLKARAPPCACCQRWPPPAAACCVSLDAASLAGTCAVWPDTRDETIVVLPALHGLHRAAPDSRAGLRQARPVCLKRNPIPATQASRACAQVSAGARWRGRRSAQALVDIVKHGLVDENQKVKTITALTVSALAEAAAPYGIESFDDVLEPLWKGIRLLRGKARSPPRWMPRG